MSSLLFFLLLFSFFGFGGEGGAIKQDITTYVLGLVPKV